MARKVFNLTFLLTCIAVATCSLRPPIVPSSELDEPLEIISSPPPEYPEEAREEEMEGKVTIEATVDVDGTVQSVEVVESSGYRLLDKSAKNAARDWIFSEPTKDGEPVRTVVVIKFSFTLS